MPLTPADVHNAAFKKPPIGKRGYDEDEVDAFLDLIEAELARLIEENNDLKQQVDDMGRPGPHGPGPQQLRQQPPPPAPAPPRPPAPRAGADADGPARPAAGAPDRREQPGRQGAGDGSGDGGEIR